MSRFIPFVSAVFVVTSSAQPDIYEWELDPFPWWGGSGIRQSSRLVPDGADVMPGPNVDLSSLDLTKAYLPGAELTGAKLSSTNLQEAYMPDANLADAVLRGASFLDADLTNANLSRVDLRNARFGELSTSPATLQGADFTDADVRNAFFYGTVRRTPWGTPLPGFTAAQLYSTASYRSGELIGIDLGGNDLRGWSFLGQNLSNANLTSSDLTDAIFADATINGASLPGIAADQLYSTASYQSRDLTDVDLSFGDVSGWNFTEQIIRSADFSNRISSRSLSAAQLYSTASYQARDLSEISLRWLNLTEWSFVRQNLAGADFREALLDSTDFTDADLTDANFASARFEGGKFSYAIVRGANFAARLNTPSPLTAAQLYSTASYQARDLRGVGFAYNDLRGWNFAGQDVRDANFDFARLADADFTGADIRGASFFPYFEGSVVRDRLSLQQLYATARYQERDLRGVAFAAVNFTDADFSGQDLRGATFNSVIHFASNNHQRHGNFTDADVRGASFIAAPALGTALQDGRYLLPTQLYSTASYLEGDLTGVSLENAPLYDWNFVGQDLTNTNFEGSAFGWPLLDLPRFELADLSGAIVRGASFSSTNLLADQLYATRSYQAQELAGIGLANKFLAGWNLTHQNLTNADFQGSTLVSSFPSSEPASADFTGSDVRGAIGLKKGGAIFTNTILPDGAIAGLDLSGGAELRIRDYDGDAERDLGAIPITVEQRLLMDESSTLQLVLEEDTWDSLISIQSGVPVTLGGALDLTFAAGVDVASQEGRTFRLFDWSGVEPMGSFEIASPYAWDDSWLYTTGEVTLTSADAQIGPVIDSPPTLVRDFQSIGSNTQLNVYEEALVGDFVFAGGSGSVNVEVNILGGQVGRFFTAREGSRVTISGGVVQKGFVANASEVVISGGRVEHGFGAFNNSQVTISGGTVEGSLTVAGSSLHIDAAAVVGHYLDAAGSQVTISGGVMSARFTAHTGTQLSITGGSVGNFLTAETGSEITIMGGSVGDAFRSSPGSQVTVHGADFRLDGVPVEGLETVGDTSPVNVPEGAFLTGVLADGTPFAFSSLESDSFSPGTLILELTPLPPVGPPLIVASAEVVPLGIREGQTLVVDAGAVVGDNFNAGIGSLVRVEEGANVGENLEAVGAEVVISGGFVNAYFNAMVGSRVSVLGGFLGRRFDAHAGSHVEIAGGVGLDDFQALPGSEVNIVGTDFLLNSTELNDLMPGETMLVEDREVELSGNLADGAPFHFDLNGTTGNGDFFSPNATLLLTWVSLLPGDYNGNGQVEQADLDLVLLHWGQDAAMAPPGWANQPPSGIIDQAELDAVLLNWGASQTTTGAPLSAGIPEPATWALCLAAVPLLYQIRCAGRNAILGQITSTVRGVRRFGRMLLRFRRA